MTGTLPIIALLAATPAIASDGTRLDLHEAHLALQLQAQGAYEAPSGAGETDVLVPVALHVVRRSDGTGGATEATLAAAIRGLDEAIGAAGIRFCRKGATQYIDDNTYFNGMTTQAEIDALRQTNAVAEAINVYFVQAMANEDGPLCSVSSFTVSPVQGIVVARACTNEFLGFLVHAIGHYFDLYDTGETIFGVECVNGFNCAVAGDLVCDTAATPDLEGHVSEDCTFEAAILGPCSGDGLYDPDPTNFMADTIPDCRTHFTPLQLARMHATLVNLRPELIDACPTVDARYHVDAAAPPGGDGLTWATAFDDLQDALDLARQLEGSLAEIWVTAGTYRPDRGTGDRDRSFELPNRVRLYGGFAGGESSLSDRDVATNPTFLSGDLDDDDQLDGGVAPPWVFDNSFHVLTAIDTDEQTLLDGFTVTGGAALGAPAPRDEGGGIYIVGGLITTRHSRFVANRAIEGGAIGAGMSGDLIASDCVFIGNWSFEGGAAVSDGWAGASDIYERCVFIRNTSVGYHGGALDGSGTFRNCLFAGNSCAGDGGAIRLRAHSVMENCTVVYNTAGDGGGGVSLPGYQFDVISSIFWGNTDVTGLTESAQIGGSVVSVEVVYSCIHMLQSFSGPGLIGDDPQFVNPIGADGMAGTDDDDYRLLLSSPCLNRGLPDLGPGGVDLDSLPRVAWCRVEMGAYELDVLHEDCDGNGEDDECDLAEGATDCNSNRLLDACEIMVDPGGADCDGNGVLDSCELVAGDAADCNGNGVPDVCDALLGTSPDCNQNGLPDECDLATTFSTISSQLAPVRIGADLSHTVAIAPIAADDVTLEFVTLSAISSSFGRRIDVEINGTHVGSAYEMGTSCESERQDTFMVPRETFNAAANGGPMTIALIPSSGITHQCTGGTWITVEVTYPVLPVSIDQNLDLVPDECQCIADCATPPDSVVNYADVLAMISAWGPGTGPCDIDGSGTVNFLDLLILLSEWGPCPS